MIIGHSERRRLFDESDEKVNQKDHRRAGAKLTPIVCIGETLEEREGKDAGRPRPADQAGLDGLNGDQIGALVIAYEPVWAIGTGATPRRSRPARRTPISGRGSAPGSAAQPAITAT